MRNILCLDAGFKSMGWAVLCGGKIVDCGVFRTKETGRKGAVRVADDNAERVMDLTRRLRDLVQRHKVAGLLVEMPSGGAQSAKAMASMARSSTIAASMAGFFDLPYEWITPADVKIAAAGARTASKEEVKAGVLKHWPGAKLPKAACEWEHVTDALGVYMAAQHGNLVRLLTKEM